MPNPMSDTEILNRLVGLLESTRNNICEEKTRLEGRLEEVNTTLSTIRQWRHS